MSTPALTKPSLREVVLDNLTYAYYARLAEIQGCRGCGRNPAGVCRDHQEDNDAAFECEQARKQIESAPSDPAVLDLFCGNVMAALSGEGEARS
jgi:hypothetical protein